jgi:hypothetical protein
MAPPATLVKDDVACILADNVESCLQPKTNFLMHVTILTLNTYGHPTNPSFLNHHAHRLIFGYSYKADSFALLLRHVGCEYLRVKHRVLVSKMKRVKGTVGIYKLALTTRHGTIHYIINANIQKTQVLFVNPGSDVNANEATFSFTNSTVFDPRDIYGDSDNDSDSSSNDNTDSVYDIESDSDSDSDNDDDNSDEI